MNNQTTIIRRYLECTGLVLLWMAGGFYFHLGPVAYQALGLPLIVGFQLVIARRPLHQLWARDAPSFRLDRGTLVLAGILMIACAALLLLGRAGRVARGSERLIIVWPLCAAAIPAAFALRQQRAADLRRALAVIAAAVIIRVAWVVVAWAPTWAGALTFPAAKLPGFFTDSLCEFVGLFLVDEVAFRGALDPHLGSACNSRLHAWSSAVFVSILWCVWHLPAYYPKATTFLGLFNDIGPLSIGTVVFGTVLSFCARRSRTLVPSAALHAANNAYFLTLLK